jgi:hypothetical protein
MATRSGRPIAFESDSAHVTFVQDSDLGLAGESKWLSASIARDLIKRGIAQESDAPVKEVKTDPQDAVFAKTGGAADSLVAFRMLATGEVFTMHWTVGVDRIRKGVAELV